MLRRSDLEALESHWAISAIPPEERLRAEETMKSSLVGSAVGRQLSLSGSFDSRDAELLERVASAYEVAAAEGIRSLLHPQQSEEDQLLRLRAQAGAARAFDFLRVLPPPSTDTRLVFHVLHLGALAYVGDRWADFRRWLREAGTRNAAGSLIDGPWDSRVLGTVFECWLRLLRKEGLSDLSEVAELVTKLRSEQHELEPAILTEPNGTDSAASIAFRLIALYHWAKGTELLAVYMLQGTPTTIEAELDKHFEAAADSAVAAGDASFEVLLRWLHLAARRMVAGSLWLVAQAVNSRVSSFVQQLTHRDLRPMFELLPPQRAAIQEGGLLDAAHRAVVVEMPTSGGKTLLAEFRILQALNQFQDRGGWVAYIAPTKALVSQLTRNLRRDFEPIGVKVEQLSPALDMDTFEEALLGGTGSDAQFEVLVSTPEKLQIILRNRKVTRPLALVVMDEAHNIEDVERGLRIELLLATVKSDSPSTSFLLLAPSISNAAQLASWLGSDSGRGISLGTTAWQPNDRLVGTYHVEPEPSLRAGWKLQFEPLLTPHHTVTLPAACDVSPTKPLNLPISSVRDNSLRQTAAMGVVFSGRERTSVTILRTIQDSWSAARLVAENLGQLEEVPVEIALVQRFLASEVGPDFEMIDLLESGVGVHNSALSDETRALIEWLTEEGKLRVLCATTTLAQGVNFPVGSVFLSSLRLPARGAPFMSKHQFWNIAGRAGRMGHDTLGVVGIAAGADVTEVRRFVADAAGDLASRLTKMLDALREAGRLADLETVIQEEEWADFRSYLAHLWNEKANIEAFLSDAESILRNTLGYGVLRSRSEASGKVEADALVNVTKDYARRLASEPSLARLADSTGFSPEVVQKALAGIREYGGNLSVEDWKPSSLFAAGGALLPHLVGVMLRTPQLSGMFKDLGLEGAETTRIADVAKAWVSGVTIQEIAKTYFASAGETDVSSAITTACKAIYHGLANAGTWSLFAFPRLQLTEEDQSRLSEDDRRQINLGPTMLYYGVSAESALLMRMNQVPRSISTRLGVTFEQRAGALRSKGAVREARKFLVELPLSEWQAASPEGATMSGEDYRMIWATLSGER